MAIKVEKTTFNLNLNLTTGKRRSEKKAIGDYIVNQIKKDASKGMSSVTGRRWLGLTKDYKNLKRKKGGSSKADMKLLGDMLNSLKFKQRADGIEVGIFNAKQATKADGHNNHTGHSSLPPRKFIPSNELEENFRPGINKAIVEMIGEEDAK